MIAEKHGTVYKAIKNTYGFYIQKQYRDIIENSEDLIFGEGGMKAWNDLEKLGRENRFDVMEDIFKSNRT